MYLNRPRKEVLVHLPRRMRVYYHLGPQWLARSGQLALNALVRWVDGAFGTTCAQYGWAFHFESGPAEVEEQPPSVNVCVQCGAGHHAELLLQENGVTGFWPRFYRCPSCSARNLFFRR